MQTTTRRILGSVAAAGVLSVAAALPATASADPGPRGSTPHPHHATPRHASPPTVIRDVQVADDSPEYLQIGLGALAGMVVAGATVVGVRRFGHRVPHPA